MEPPLASHRSGPHQSPKHCRHRLTVPTAALISSSPSTAPDHLPDRNYRLDISTRCPLHSASRINVCCKPIITSGVGNNKLSVSWRDKASRSVSMSTGGLARGPACRPTELVMAAATHVSFPSPFFLSAPRPAGVWLVEWVEQWIITLSLMLSLTSWLLSLLTLQCDELSEPCECSSHCEPYGKTSGNC